jgi:hypothetical protein
MVLMTQGNSDGERRCDSRCYNAEGPDCDCCCGGINHGVGLKQARDNTARVAEALAEADADIKRLCDRVRVAAVQGELF